MQEKENADGSISGVKYIGNNAFQGCSNLKKVQMANSVEEVGVQVFYGDVQLTDINISINLESISDYMFSDCTNLKTIEIPEGVISIDGYGFSGCTNLETIKIPKTLQKIDPTAFNRCTKLTNMDLSGNLNFSFENGILLGNNKTEMVIILESAINGNTFSIPNTVTTLASGQIAQYTNITKVVIPASVTTIASNFFTSNITEVSIDAGNATYETDGKAIYTKDIENKELVKYYGNETAVIIEKEIKVIKDYAFADKNLSSIEFPDTLETIGSQVFSGCTQLKELSLGININSFNSMSIYNSGIEKITLKPDSQGNVNPNFSIRKAKCNGIETDALFNADGTQFISPIKMLGSISTYEIPEGVEQIADYAFHNQNKMTSIMLPNTVERIGISFNYCASLQSIEIPSSVQEISAICFTEANNLTQIKINKPKGSIANAPWGCIYGDKALIWLSE